MILEIVLLAFAIALLRGGSFGTLADLRLRRLWLAFVWPAVIVVLLVLRKVGFEPLVLRVSGPLHVLSLIPWLALCLSNRRMSGMMLIALGVVLNFWPIAFNNGRMPVSIPMAYRANVGQQVKDYVTKHKMERHCVMSRRTRVNWLADWVPVPRPPFYIGATVASPGDLLDTLGMFLLIQTAMGAPFRKPRKDERAAQE